MLATKKSNVHKWWTLTVVCLATFMLLLDITIVNVALPSIQKDLHAGFSDLQWVIDAYSLTLATLVLNAGSLADRYGRKKIFIIGIALFTLASAICGAATSPVMLIVSRAVQGIGGGFMFATSLSLLAQDFHGKERGTAFGIWGAITGIAVAVGPLVGGTLINAGSWRWIFFVNLPIGILTIAATAMKVRESRNSKETKTDWSGVILLTAALFCLIFALIKANSWGWSSTNILSLFAGGIVLLAAFLAVEVYKKQPILELKLFKIPSFTAAQLAAFALSGSIFSLFLYITLYLQDVLGYSPLATGVRFLPVTGMMFVVAAISGRMSAKVSPKVLIGGGLVAVAIGLILMHGVSDSSSWTVLLPGLIVSGLGVGMVNPALANLAIGVVPPEESGMASGANNTFRQIGIASGVAILGALFQSKIQHVVSSSLAVAKLSGKQIQSIAQAVSSGATKQVIQQAPKSYKGFLVHTTKTAFISGLNELFWVAAVIAGAGAVITFVAVRRKDFSVYPH